MLITVLAIGLAANVLLSGVLVGLVLHQRTAQRQLQREALLDRLYRGTMGEALLDRLYRGTMGADA